MVVRAVPRQPSLGAMTSIWAHRGASGDAPENTLAAFELAARQGADGIELDVQRTADGELVVCHDETIDRTSTGSGAIVAHTLAELRRHDFGGPGGAGGPTAVLPTLREVFELVRGTSMACNVELKDTIEPYPGMAEQVLELVAEFGLGERTWVSTFNHWTLRELAGRGTSGLGGVRLGVLFQDGLVDPWRYAADLGVQAIHPPWQYLAALPQTVELCHEAGLAVHPWTCNTDAEITRVLGLGVDAVITNHPRRARELAGPA